MFYVKKVINAYFAILSYIRYSLLLNIKNVCKRQICKSQIQGNCRLHEISLFEVEKIDRGNREALVTDASLLYIEWNILKLYDMC